MPSSEFVPTNVWASNSAAGQTEELILESGQTCLAKKMSIDGMIESGMLAEADALTAQMTKYTRKVKGGKKADGVEIDEAALLRDSSGIQAMVALMDKALPHIVISPVVRLHYTETKVGKTTVTKTIPLDEREEGVIYTDQVDFADKAELFNWAAGGLAAMLQFRK